jgi:exonuclease SbcC
MPLVLDDVFMTSDDERAEHMFEALARFAMNHQVLLFTHHHQLTQIAAKAVDTNLLGLHQLMPSSERVSEWIRRGA